MKKTLVFLLAVLTAMSLLSGCGGSANPAPSASVPDAQTPFDVSTIKTMGDAMAFESPTSSWSSTTYVYVFEVNGVYYRATARLPEDVSKALDEIDFLDEQYDEKVQELLAPVELSNLENLNELIPPQEELDKLVGKTGQELLDDGWNPWACNWETLEFNMYHGLFNYIVVFDGQLEMSDDLEMDEDIKPLTVKSVTYEGIGQGASNFEEDEEDEELAEAPEAEAADEIPEEAADATEADGAEAPEAEAADEISEEAADATAPEA